MTTASDAGTAYLEPSADGVEGMLPLDSTHQPPCVTRLALSNFRNYTQCFLELHPAPIVITGENGAGKTNILEAVSLLAPGRGLRQAKLPEMHYCADTTGIPWAMAASLTTEITRHDITTGWEPSSTTDGMGKRHIKIDGKSIHQQQKLTELCSIVWITPQMDGLFLGPASERRRFLDRMVTHRNPHHGSLISQYEHTMRQRLMLLKDRSPDSNWLGSLEQQMAEFATAIAAGRIALVAQLSEFGIHHDTPFPSIGVSLTGKVEEALQNEPALQVEVHFRTELEKNRQIDTSTGRTNAGIHRNDLVVYHGQKKMPASLCSTGEQKALLVSVLLADVRARIAKNGTMPIVLLDEVIAHLDDTRRVALLQEILHLGVQAWMTGTDASLFAPLRDKSQFFMVKQNDLCLA